MRNHFAKEEISFAEIKVYPCFRVQALVLDIDPWQALKKKMASRKFKLLTLQNNVKFNIWEIKVVCLTLNNKSFSKNKRVLADNQEWAVINCGLFNMSLSKTWVTCAPLEKAVKARFEKVDKNQLI